MKKLLIVCIVVLCSCNNKQKEVKTPIMKHNVGEIIFMKPDSVKGYIYSVDKEQQFYKVSYFDKLGKEDVTYIQELQIYGK